MLHFATCFDANYLSRGMALLESLTERSTIPFRLYILALDEKVNAFFKKSVIENIVIISLDEIELYFPELQNAKTNRSIIEYYFTLSPYLPLYILNQFPKVERITTMDADLYFFNDPNIILNSYASASVLITPHHFSSELKHLEVYGKYNVSFQSFKKDKNGLECLNHWAEQCVEWCYDYLDEPNNRFADQKYLDNWKSQFSNVEEINLPGAGLAPWNIEAYAYSSHKDKILVDSNPLIYFHFHHLRIFNRYFAISGLEKYGVNVDRIEVKNIYHAYLKKLTFFSKEVSKDGTFITRDNVNQSDNFFRKLLYPSGYWIFKTNYIRHVNLSAQYIKFKKILKKLWPA